MCEDAGRRPPTSDERLTYRLELAEDPEHFLLEGFGRAWQRWLRRCERGGRHGY